MAADVSIIIVSHNDAADLPHSIESALAQRGISSETVLVDNASTDASADVAKKYLPRLRLIALPQNVGFAAAMNAGIEATIGRYVVALNPDCRLDPEFCSVLAARLERSPEVGSASGRIYRAQGEALEPTPLLDSTGIVFTASGRHFDRGSQEEAAGRYVDEEPVAGASGAAGFYRREALESAWISTGCFDSDFFLYREDADLAWRLRRLGWKCLYVPAALAYHRRRNLPSRRRQMRPEVNFHSVKNRFLLRINNQSAGDFFATLLPTLARDVVVLGACLTVERTSLPAFGWLWRSRKRLWSKRREIKGLVHRRRETPVIPSLGSGQALRREAPKDPGL